MDNDGFSYPEELQKKHSNDSYENRISTESEVDIKIKVSLGSYGGEYEDIRLLVCLVDLYQNLKLGCLHPVACIRFRGFRLTQLCFNRCLLFYLYYPLNVSVVRPS
jgi:hypothetical protein